MVVVLVDSDVDVDVSTVVVVLSVTAEVSDDVDGLISVEDEVEESVTGIVDGLISVEDDVESGAVVGDAVVESVDDGTTVVPQDELANEVHLLATGSYTLVPGHVKR